VFHTLITAQYSTRRKVYLVYQYNARPDAAPQCQAKATGGGKSTLGPAPNVNGELAGQGMEVPQGSILDPNRLYISGAIARNGQ
jgi:hypothetical protein